MLFYFVRMCLKKKLLSGTTLIIFFFSLSCFQTNKKSFALIDSITINSFPSASAVEFHNNKFYVFGDDAAYLLVLDTNFNIVEKIYFKDSIAERLSPEEKPDIESTSINKEGGRSYLYAFGSHSSGNRKKILRFPLDSLQNFTVLPHSISENPLLKVLNIEGAAFVNGELLLANRANNSFRTNYIFIENIENTSRTSSIPQIMEIQFPESKNITGISGLFYFEEKDILFFTASQEETTDPLVDGPIGNSFLGWIYNFSKNRNVKLKPDNLIDLLHADSQFKGSKIESVTVQQYKDNHLHLILVADNDDGKSILYKVNVDVSR
ncbi:MAG: hypothetical protein H0V91_11035 [Flavisolibacter sp.]|nr:hypothetical protein [Flavisolibacter sp.]